MLEKYTFIKGEEVEVHRGIEEVEEEHKGEEEALAEMLREQQRGAKGMTVSVAVQQYQLPPYDLIKGLFADYQVREEARLVGAGGGASGRAGRGTAGRGGQAADGWQLQPFSPCLTRCFSGS